MSRLILKICIDKFKSLPRDENGAAMMITLAVVLFLYLLCSSTYAIGMTINEKIQLQNAADAAAYSAAVVEADGLSRIATINRAMSWTYIQTVKRRMDYIVLEWLYLTSQRFQQDENMCRDFNDKNYNDWTFPAKVQGYSYTSRRCGQHESGSRGNGTWWCGWDTTDGISEESALIKFGHLTREESKEATSRSDFLFGKMIPHHTIKSSILNDYSNLSYQLRCAMDDDLLIVDSLNAMLKVNIRDLYDNMNKMAFNVLQWNLPNENKGGEYFYRIDLPITNDPYIDMTIEDGSDAVMEGIFSAYKNTEEDELEFLAASLNSEDQNSAIWKNGFLFQDILGDGIDQWFIRGSKDTFLTSGEVNNFKASIDDYAMRGIQRGYKSANRAEALAGTSQLRGNHVAWGSPTGSVISMGAALPTWAQKTLTPITVSLGAFVSSFWKAADVFAKGATSDIIPSAINAKNIFIEQCQSPKAMDNYGLVAEYHWSSMRWWCALRWKWVRVGPFTKIPIPIGVVHYKTDPINSCSIHGGGGTGTYSRNDYRQCYVGKYMLNDLSAHGSENKFPGYLTMGYSRIYGDDSAVFDKVYIEDGKERVNKNYYITPKFEPVKLNKNFFGKRINVAVGKKMKNPFYWFFSSEDTFREVAPVNSIFALFNPGLIKNDGSQSNSLLLATSSATAAFKSRRNSLNDHYEISYDQLTSFEYDDNFGDEPTIHLRHGSGVSASDAELFKKLRIGCPHANETNEIAQRLRKVWNLCETDWQAVFVPHKYVNDNYQAYNLDVNSNCTPYDSHAALRRNDILMHIYRPYAVTYTDFISKLGTPDNQGVYLSPLYGSSVSGVGMSVMHPAVNNSGIRIYTPRQLFQRLQKFKLQ